MGIFRRLAGFLGFSKDDGHAVRDDDNNVASHNNKGFTAPVSRDVPGPILVPCITGAGGIQVITQIAF